MCLGCTRVKEFSALGKDIFNPSVISVLVLLLRHTERKENEEETKIVHIFYNCLTMQPNGDLANKVGVISLCQLSLIYEDCIL